MVNNFVIIIDRTLRFTLHNSLYTKELLVAICSDSIHGEETIYGTHRSFSLRISRLTDYHLDGNQFFDIGLLSGSTALSRENFCIFGIY